MKLLNSDTRYECVALPLSYCGFYLLFSASYTSKWHRDAGVNSPRQQTDPRTHVLAAAAPNHRNVQPLATVAWSLSANRVGFKSRRHMGAMARERPTKAGRYTLAGRWRVDGRQPRHRSTTARWRKADPQVYGLLVIDRGEWSVDADGALMILGC